jgi:hypothetical protein
VLGDFVDLIRDKAVGFAVDADRGAGVGGVHQADTQPSLSSTQ